MGRVFVAGSINMDVVATADRHPQVGETVAGNAVLYFPGGKGANQAVSAAKLGASTTLVGRLGQDAFGNELKAYLAAEGIDLGFIRQTADAHTGTAIVTVAKADNTIVVIPGANAEVDAADVARPVLAKGDIAVSQFEIPLPRSARSLPARERPARRRSSIRRRRRNSAPNCLISSTSSCSTRPSLAYWPSKNFATATMTPASSTRRDPCRPAKTGSFA
jgi:pfkB family carbohydrate kinase